MKKIGIVTCYIDNYGACLQAFSVQTLTQSYGFNPKILRYDYTVNINENKMGTFKRLVFICKSIVNVVLRRIKIVEFVKEHDSIVRHNRFAEFRLKKLCFTKRINEFKDLNQIDSDFDLYICGSDQIWNPTLSGARDLDFDTLFFTNKYKIAYAPSIGIDHIPCEYVSKMKNNISLINCVSCRESVGTNLIINQLGIQNCITVLDPTLLLDKKNWIQLSNAKKRKKRYIFCYFFNWSELYEESISFFSKLLGDVEVLSIAFSKNDYIFKKTKNISPSVENFPTIIANAELVLTDSFHGVAFCINMNTNFYVFSRFRNDDPVSMNSRINSVLSLFNLNDRLIDSKDCLFNKKNNYKIDFTTCNKVLEEERVKSFKFLESSFNNAK